VALTLLIPYVGVLAAYQFETRRISAFELNALAQDPNLPKPLLTAGHVLRVVPMAAPSPNGPAPKPALRLRGLQPETLYRIPDRWNAEIGYIQPAEAR
jgi:hypothetical protein